MSLAGVAKQTLEISETGYYLAPSGATINISVEVQESKRDTQLWTPAQLESLLSSAPATTGAPPEVSVIDAKTQTAARALYAQGETDLVALNFASAKNPGGGFLRGAKAQEEDLARASALYVTQLTAREYYNANRACRHMLYTDHMIYSPRVPFFREGRALIDEPFLTSVITAPAPNAGQAKRKGQGKGVQEALHKRAGMVLALAQEKGHRTLLLGAWGCGVFRNDPNMVAQAFKTWLIDPRFAGAFSKVIFAVPKDKTSNYGTFAAKFGTPLVSAPSTDPAG